MLTPEKMFLNYQVYGDSFSLKINAMERVFYKQIKLAKSLEFKFNTVKNKGTSNLRPISLISYLSKKKLQ